MAFSNLLERYSTFIHGAITVEGRYENTILTRFLAHTDCFMIPAQARGGIFKLLRSPGINSKESVPPAYDNPILTRFLAPIDHSKIPAQAKGVLRPRGATPPPPHPSCIRSEGR